MNYRNLLKIIIVSLLGLETVAVEQSNSEDVSRRYPREVLWDPLDPRLLVVQASPLSVDITDKSHIKKPTPTG